MDSDLMFDLNAASWRHGHADEEAFVEALADRLGKSLADLVRVEREHRLFAKTHSCKRITVDFDGESFVLERTGGRFEARKAKTVRGVVLSSKVLPMKEWLGELSAALSAFAREHEDAHDALKEFLL